MGVRRVRDRQRAAAVACSIAFCAAWLAGCVAGRTEGEGATLSPGSGGPAATVVRVLQVNLCNSGRAACYTGGRAVGMVMGLVHQWRPGMLTLNEVCRDDVGVLKQAMSAAFPAAKVASAFASARNDIGDGPVRCRNGQEFGDGVLVVERPSALGLRSNSGVYPVQDPGDFEQRAWVCLDVDGGFLACTTHTASTNATVALGQCRYLLASVVPGHDPRAGGHPVVVGADLNLTARGAPSPEACLPSGYQRTDDGGVQDVIVGPGIRVPSRWVIDMRGTTDHPGLLVDVLISRR